ncbi:pentatricopeptide repeat-containing protein At5g46580, chloroplastic-like [Aristolochia californica]|uniref:pentatricopeptide repeat-containing protein At5g46580, chloroplastic-like n=1 Tax=Aristolochia californica TaxID=171875 RepID=UPI0035DC1E4B
MVHFFLSAQISEMATISPPLDPKLTSSYSKTSRVSSRNRASATRFTIRCSSTESSSRYPLQNSLNPSLSDQLQPLSLTLLSNTTKKPPPPLRSKPKSTWVNPSRPKHSVLSLRRHIKSPYSYNPDLRNLKHFAQKLSNADLSESAFFAALDESEPSPTRDDALLILNSLKAWQKACLFFKWLKTKNLFPLETIFYNVLMKSLRQGRQFQLIEELANEMMEKGIPLDNITYSTIITCAKRCNLFDKALEWFESMYKTGLMPDEVTYSVVLDVYSKLGKVEEVISLYERARASGWTPDAVAFSVLGKMFGEAGDYDGIQYVLQEMKAVGVQPNLVVYNTLLEAMGKAGKPGLARSLFEEMVAAGVTPNEKTLTALIKIYGKARWGRDALSLWERMQSNKWPMDFILYNTLLSMCADLGLEEEAERLFGEMKRSEICQPDSWSYTAMMNTYASGGNVDKAMELFVEMLECEVHLNVMTSTCLIQCLGRGKRIDEVVRVFGIVIKKGIEVDDRLCGCLLSCVTYCEEAEEMEKVLDCLEKANPALVNFVRLIGREDVSFDLVKEQFRKILNSAVVEVRRPFCNCLIDICQKQNLPERAHELLYLGTVYGLYPGLHCKNATKWSLNLRSLSMGAAFTAFQEWMRTLSKAVDRKEELPPLFFIYTGAGTHKHSQGLGNAFAAHLKNLAAPFQKNEKEPGCFIARQEDVLSWVQSGGSVV